MSNRFEELANRKRVLIEKCAREREALAASWNRIRLPFNVGSLLLGLGKILRAHPVLAAGISGLLVSGHGGKIRRSLGMLLRLGNAIQPLWFWWTKRSRRG